jgi:hypothetical protein
MVAKVSWTASWVPMRSLPWKQRKKWIPIGSIKCVHMHWGVLVIEGWGNPSCIWNDVEKTREVN